MTITTGKKSVVDEVVKPPINDWRERIMFARERPGHPIYMDTEQIATIRENKFRGKLRQKVTLTK